MRAKLIKLFTKHYMSISIVFIIVFLVLLLFYAAFYENDILKIRQKQANNQQILVEAQQNIIIKEFDGLSSSLNFLYESPNFQAYLNDNGNKHIVENEWVSFANNMKKYDQIRYLDTNGNEQIRVDYQNGRALKVNDADLQNKSKSYYFKDAIVLNNGEIYVSKLDLHVENDTIELPIKPMLRIALPVFDKNKTRRGIIVANYLVEFILHDIKSLNRNNKYAQLVNADGYWLAAPDPEDEWAFMYPERSNISFKNKFPEEWKLIKTEKNGQFFTDGGLFTFNTIYPSEQIYFTSEKYADTIRPNSYHSELVLILQILTGDEPYINDRNSYILAMFTFFDSIYSVLGLITISLFIAILFGLHMIEIEKTKKMATFDDLTGCLNRVHGINIIESEMLRSGRYKIPLSLIIMDLDYFKAVNDTWGHPVGDEVLKLISDLTRKNIRNSDSLIRIGGEEFIIFSPESNIKDTAALAEKIRKILAETIHPIVGNVTVSFGVAQVLPAESFNDWYGRADAALYQAKNNGRNCVVQANASS